MRKVIPASAAVYAITTSRTFGRLDGTSNILYVGSTRRLGGPSDRARLWAYSYPPTPREKRITAVCAALAADGHVLTLRWHIVTTLLDAQSLEATFLHQVADEHRELPPLNHAIPTLKVSEETRQA